MKIFELFGSILVENDSANEALDTTGSKAESITSKLGSGIKTAAEWSVATVAAAGAVGAAALGMANDFADTTDNIDKMSQKLGLSREGYQEWDFIASQSGASIDSLKTSMTTLNNSFDQLKDGSGTGAEAFEALGLSLEDLQGKSQEEIFESTITALQGVTDESERAAIANDLLGKGSTELAALLNTSAEATEDMKQQAHDLGLVIGDEAIDAGVQFTDTMDQLKRAFSATGTNLAATIMPAVQEFADIIMDNMPLIQSVISDVFGVFGNAVEFVMPLLTTLATDILPNFIDNLVSIGEGIMPVVVELMGVITDTILPVFLESMTMLSESIMPVLNDLFDVIVNNILPPLIELFSTIIEEALPPLMELFTTIIDTILPPLIDLFTQIIDAVFPTLIELVNQFVEEILPPFIDIINLVVDTIIPPLIDIFQFLVDKVIPPVMAIFENMGDVISDVMYAVEGVIKTVMGIITGDWDAAWEGIKQTFSGILDAIVDYLSVFTEPFEEAFTALSDFVSGIWDGIGETIKDGINYIISAINSFIEGINKMKVPDWVPAVGGLGFSLSTIPLLADGGNITGSGMAIVGEAGPELINFNAGASVTPLTGSDSTVSQNINNNFNISSIVVREEADIKKVARELYNMQIANARG